MPKKQLRPAIRWEGVDMNDPQIRAHFERMQIQRFGSVISKPDNSGLLMRPGWEVQSYERGENIVYATATYQKSDNPACPHCGTIGEYVQFGTREQTFADIPAKGKALHIRVQRQRYRCQACGKTWMQRLPDMDSKHMMTRDLVHWLRDEAMKRTFTSIAEEVGITEVTIRRIFGEYVADLDATHTPYTPEWLGIDEVHLVGGPRGMFTDVLNRRPIELLPKRTADAVTRFLLTLDRPKVRVVVMDMWKAYRTVAREMFPSARIVVDKFHVLQLASKAMETVRKRTRAELPDRQRRQLKKDRFILLRRRFELKESDLLLLSTWIENFADLGKAYQMKEAFADIYSVPDRATAEARYRQWKAALPESIADAFKELTTAMDNWHDEIFAYFDVGVTNAYTEAMNGVIKQVNRQGRGYSFQVLRAKLLYHPSRRMPDASDSAFKIPAGTYIEDWRDVEPEYRPVYDPQDGSRIALVIIKPRTHRRKDQP